MSGGKKKLIFGVVVVLAAVLSICFFVMLVAIGIRATSDSNKAIKSSSGSGYEYKYLHLEAGSNKPNTGSLTHPKYLSEHESMAYRDNYGNFNLISNFGSDEYVCTGSCYCNTDEYRRSTTAFSSLLKKGIGILAIGVTASVAYRNAKEHLSKECQETFSSETCPRSAIMAEVDKCDAVEEIEREIGEPVADENEGEIPKDYERYWCNGKCQTKPFSKPESIKAAEDFKCKKMSTGSPVVVEISQIPPKERNAFARTKFIAEELSEFCRTSSLKKYRYKSDVEGGEPKIQELSLCVAERADEPNKTAKCIRIFWDESYGTGEKVEEKPEVKEPDQVMEAEEVAKEESNEGGEKPPGTPVTH